MAHLVRHRTPAGETVTAEVADLDAAVSLVERLHNDDHAEDVRVFAEVPLRFETYVRVSVAADEPAEDVAPPQARSDAAASDGTGDVAPPMVDDAPAEPAPPAEAAVPVPPPPGVLAPVRVEAPSADAEGLVDASPADARRGLFHRG